MMPIISIIIPHKNIPTLLERCLLSIPDIEDLQVIVVDDNSDNEYLNDLRSLSKARKYTSFIETKDDKGAGYARNIGLKSAIGKWILFADADDTFSSDFYNIISLYLNSCYDVVYFKYKIYTGNNKSNNENSYNKTLSLNSYNDKYKAIYFIIPFSKLIKRSLLVDNKIDFEEIRYSNDIMFSVKVGVCAKKIFIDKYHVIYHYFNRVESLVNTYTKEALLCRLNAVIRVHKYLKKNNCEDCMIQMSSYLLIFASYIGIKEILYVTWKLFTNNLLFYREKGKDSFDLNKYIRIYIKMLFYSITNKLKIYKKVS